MKPAASFDFVVIGAGPAGHQAAVTAAEAGASVLLVERGSQLGGECVFRGTIPSKTLLASARRLVQLRRLRPDLAKGGEGSPVPQLMQRLSRVLDGYSCDMQAEVEAAGVQVLHARARLQGPHEVECERLDGSCTLVHAEHLVLATGTRPRQPPELPLDHEVILDSDSALSLAYLPDSLTVVGAGVIACEFASLFQALGVRVTLFDKHPLPMGFLDPELSRAFLEAFTSGGGRFIPEAQVEFMTRGRVNGVSTRLTTGEVLETSKALVAMGRVASLKGLQLELAGLEPNDRGLLDVDEVGRTAVPHIYAAGDIKGAPALAAASMHQGRRAVRHALGLPLGPPPEQIPTGIYTLPEMASVGLTESQVRERMGGALVGRASFESVARARIDGQGHGLLKLVCDPRGERVLGVHCFSDQATELVHLGQMALLGGHGPEVFEDTVFNFPTTAQAYSLAARDCLAQRARLAA